MSTMSALNISINIRRKLMLMLMSRLSSQAHKLLMLMFINMFTENPWTGNFEGELNTLNPIIFTERRPGTSRTTENKRKYRQNGMKRAKHNFITGIKRHVIILL